MASLAWHPPLFFTVIVYVVLNVGEAVGLGHVVQLNPTFGLHSMLVTSEDVAEGN